MALTDAKIRAAKPTDKAYKLTDGAGMLTGVSVIGDPDAPQQPGKYFWFRAVSRGISQPLTHRLSLRAGALIRSVHVLYRNGHRGSWRVTADFTHQRSCICTLIHERFTALCYRRDLLS